MREIRRRDVIAAMCGAAAAAMFPAVPIPAAATETDVWIPGPGVLAEAARTPDRYDGAGASCHGGLTPAAVALRSVIVRDTGITDIGGYACRANTASPSRLSVHAAGRALDVMVRGARGDQIADALIAHADELAVQLVIWRRRIWRSGTGTLRAYGGPNPHTDHIHVEVFDGAPGRATDQGGDMLVTVNVTPRLVR